MNALEVEKLIAPYYEADGITIYNADCAAVLPCLPKFDLLLTDPPYGIGADDYIRNLSRSKLTAARDFGDGGWDTRPPAELLDSCRERCHDSVVWGGNYFQLPPSSCWFVWDKDNGTNDFADCELAWTTSSKAVRKFRWRWKGMLKERPEPRVHPTQKPLALMRWCLSWFSQAETVLDPFAGSGTTLLAAKLEGRQCVGVEVSERFCEAAAKRLEQGVLF